MRMEEGRSNLRFDPPSERRRNYWMNERKFRREVSRGRGREEGGGEGRDEDEGEGRLDGKRFPYETVSQLRRLIKDRARSIKADRSQEEKTVVVVF